MTWHVVRIFALSAALLIAPAAKAIAQTGDPEPLSIARQGYLFAGGKYSTVNDRQVMTGQWPGSGLPGDPVFDQFYASQTPSIQDFTLQQVLNRDAILALLERIGPAILLTHSQSGAFGWPVADARPDLVKAVLAVEPKDALLAEAHRVVAHERLATAHVIALLVELDARRLYLGEGYSSLFVYCTQALHLSEHATYGRIEAARAARRFPVILDLLADGSITLTTVTLLTSELTPENHRAVLESARHKSKRDILLLVATLRPRPAVPSVVRKLPASMPVASAARAESEALLSQCTDGQAHAASSAATTVVTLPPTRPAVVAPLAPERYRIQFTVTRETYEKLRRVQDLLRHAIPDGDPAEIFDRALTLLMDDVAKTKLAATKRPRRSGPTAAGSRHIPAAVKRAVWARDGGRCAFVGTSGRCAETGFLEFHHVVPYAAGGAATVENLELLCAAHNKYEAECFFGPSEPSFVRESARPEYGCDANSVRTESSRCCISSRSGPG